MKDIQFYIPSDEVIPTDLWLLVGETKVRYERILHGFKFEVYEADVYKAQKIIDKIIKQMLIDHDESHHGVSWVTTSLKEVFSYGIEMHTYEWHYRVRDSY